MRTSKRQLALAIGAFSPLLMGDFEGLGVLVYGIAIASCIAATATWVLWAWLGSTLRALSFFGAIFSLWLLPASACTVAFIVAWPFAWSSSRDQARQAARPPPRASSPKGGS